MVGEAGPEAVVPLSGAGRGGPGPRLHRRQELRGLVRTEIVDSNTGIARTLLAGVALMAIVLTVEPAVQNVRIALTVPAGHDRSPPPAPARPARAPGCAAGTQATVEPGPLIVRDYEAPIGVPLTYTVDDLG